MPKNKDDENEDENEDEDTVETQTRTIFAAIAADNVEALQQVFQSDHYANINVKTHFLETPLILAAKNNQLAMVEAILKIKNTHVNSQDIHGDTALHLAVRHNYLDVAKVLLHDWRTCIKVENNNNELVIHLICYRGHVELFQRLEAYRDLNVNVPDILHYTPIMYVLVKLYDTLAPAYERLLQNLLTRGATIFIPDIVERVEVLYKFFLHHPRFNVNGPLNKHYTLFSYCCTTGNVEMFLNLMRHPAFQRQNYTEHLLMALRHGHLPLCLEMLAQQPEDDDVSIVPEAFKYLTYDEDVVQIMDFLLGKNKVTIEQILIKAVYYKRCDVIKTYVGRGHASDFMLMYIMSNFKSMFYHIIEHNCGISSLNVRMSDRHGNTLLHLAVQYNYTVTLLKKLLRLGCDPDALNHEGHKALHYCTENNIDIDKLNLLLPVTALHGTEVFNYLSIYVCIEKNLLVNMFKNVHWHTVYGPGLAEMPIYNYILLLEFLKTLDTSQRERMVLHMLGGAQSRYIEVRAAIHATSLYHSHNTTDIHTLEDINPFQRVEIVQYGPPIHQKYKTLTHTTLLHLIKSHHSHYHHQDDLNSQLKHLTDPFDRTPLHTTTVFSTGEPLFLDCLLRALITAKLGHTFI
jgi:hypothetical protein